MLALNPSQPPTPALLYPPRLKDKKQEEDSDGEDEALPLTDEEKERHRQDLAQHREECRQVGSQEG